MQEATEQHREQLIKYESKFLTDRHSLIADKEDALVAMEQRQLHTKHQTVKEQMKEQYRLQRSQLQRRLTAEIDHLKSAHEKASKDLEIKQRQAKKRLPSIQKTEARARLNMYKQKLKIELTSAANTKIKLRNFQSDEITRQSRERADLQLKQEKQKIKLEDDHKFDIDEMQQHHIEKKKLLMQREQDRILALDDAFSRDFNSWQQQVPMRKMLLEKKFEQQKADRAKFFNKQELHKNNTLMRASVSHSVSNENLSGVGKNRSYFLGWANKNFKTIFF